MGVCMYVSICLFPNCVQGMAWHGMRVGTLHLQQVYVHVSVYHCRGGKVGGQGRRLASAAAHRRQDSA